MIVFVTASVAAAKATFRRQEDHLLQGHGGSPRMDARRHQKNKITSRRAASAPRVPARGDTGSRSGTVASRR